MDELFAQYEREGKALLHRLDADENTDSILFLALLERIDPVQMRAGMEDAFIGAGMTNADVRTLIEKLEAKIRSVN